MIEARGELEKEGMSYIRRGRKEETGLLLSNITKEEKQADEGWEYLTRREDIEKMEGKMTNK